VDLDYQLKVVQVWISLHIVHYYTVIETD